ncbi:hypothetical protein [Nocardia seriolae]|uniref:DUF222 domain-containing protein n=3 Tax=Nocardia seriolae TaxID=37332 RepID=A0ABC9YWQ6_9NOCA|nr:hypothetical protein [Nocardia seriolae]OJF83359.1 hypothetical protein NS14008_34920 [Nocardia seriolae]PSK30073.1 hypothetical protein C6575_17755 [Nocardia seriolae]QOW32122.1 hypothetical protein IMZ23_29600 [Nocardia seriolae]QUN19733.1 hypothetical protein KEC46_10670 [Nocardia seriolae]RLP30720.1 hypothetical protein D6158_17085 [Nocardia seriolae]
MSDGEVDPVEAHEQYLRAFRHPAVSRDQLRDLLDAVNAFLDTITPKDGEFVLRGGWAPESTAMAFQIGRAVEQVLSEREDADRELVRRRDIRDRLVAALDAVLDCLRTLPELAEAEVKLGTTCVNEGFQVFDDGSVRTTPAQEAAADPGLLKRRRAELDEQMTAAVAIRAGLVDDTTDLIRERLGVADVGIPWVILAATRGGLDVSEPFEFAAEHLPDSELRDLMVQLVTDIELTRTLEESAE